jgi:peptidoglycan-N-acetylglucosamine deacetylase
MLRLLKNLLITALFSSWYNSMIHRRIGKQINLEKAIFILSFDVDFEEDVFALKPVIALLEKYKIKASFAVIGKWIEKFPMEHSNIISHGHEIINHTYSHPNNTELNPNIYFDELSFEEKEKEIKYCDELIRLKLNYIPKGFRTPHFGILHNPDVYKILKKLNYSYSSSTISTGTNSKGYPFHEENGIWEIPVSTCPKHPFTCFDSWHSFHVKKPFGKQQTWHQKDFQKIFKKLIKVAIKQKSIVNLYFDPRDMVKNNILDEMLNSIVSSNKLSLCNYFEFISVFL